MISVLIRKIKEIDYTLFYYINHTLKNPFLDKWMPFVTDIDNWKIFLFAAWAALFIFGGRRGRLVCILSVIAVLVADNITSYILKPFFGRVRPFAHAAQGPGISPSFPSGHAVNVFTLAMILSWYYYKMFPAWFAAAGVVGFSRVYVGAHYPLDVAGGAATGIFCGLCACLCGNYIDGKMKEKDKCSG